MGLIEKLEKIKELVESGAGGGSSEPFLTNWGYLFYRGVRLDQFNDFVKISGQITTMVSCFDMLPTNTYNIDFTNVDLSLCSEFSRCFYSGSSSTIFKGTIKNIDMSSARGLSNIWATSSSYGQYITELSFKGSLGGKSNISSLTLQLQGLTSLTQDNINNILLTLEPNESGYTRTIKLSSDHYSNLSTEALEIATNNGYTIAT